MRQAEALVHHHPPGSSDSSFSIRKALGGRAGDRRNPPPNPFMEDEGSYRSRILEGRDGYDRSDEDIRKLNKTFEMRFAKIKFKGDYYENWELFAEEYVSYCKRQRVMMDERLDLVPITLAGNAKQFYIDEIQKPASKANKSMSWGGMLQKFNDRFASETKRERMSLFLQIYSFEREHSDSSQALEKLIAQINKISPMARERDRADEAKSIFLKSAIISRSWGVNALASLKGKRYTYQDLIDALFGSIADQVAHTESFAREEVADSGRG